MFWLLSQLVAPTAENWPKSIMFRAIHLISDDFCTGIAITKLCPQSINGNGFSLHLLPCQLLEPKHASHITSWVLCCMRANPQHFYNNTLNTTNPSMSCTLHICFLIKWPVLHSRVIQTLIPIARKNLKYTLTLNRNQSDPASIYATVTYSPIATAWRDLLSQLTLWFCSSTI